jgi:hypothetical protein
MANTYTLIDKTTLTGTQSSITFTSIPNTFTDLVVLLSVRSNRSFTNDSLGIKPNGSTSNRSGRTLLGDGSSASSTTTTEEIAYAALTGGTATSNTFSNIAIYCPNYTSSNFKSMSADGVMENNATFSGSSLNAFLWSNTAAITSLEFTSATGNSFVSGCTAYLYGIKNS